MDGAIQRTCKQCLRSAVYQNTENRRDKDNGKLICRASLPDAIEGLSFSVNMKCEEARYRGPCGAQGIYWEPQI